MKTKILIGILFCFFISCQKHQEPDISFYYWKTIFKLSPKEKHLLTDLNVKRLYIRYFDVDLGQKPFPRSPIRFEQSPEGMDIVPVVYIKNKVMLEKSLNVIELAQQTNHLINQINLKHHLKVKEIQIDCDWSLKSQLNYMRFIEEFKKISQKKLSSTIRLHQIKYFRKTKIPKVDRGVLMYYNMGKLAPDSLNSIYDLQIANRYIKSLKKYPLPLDFALPIFSWGIHIRDNSIIGLINKKDCIAIRNSSHFILGKNKRYYCKNSNFLNGIFYKEKDQIKVEAVPDVDLLQMANSLSQNCRQTPNEILFYDLDELNLVNYEKGLFKEIIDCF